MAESLTDIILRIDRKHKIIFYNDALIKHFDFLNTDDIRGKSLTELDVFNEVVGPTWQAKIDDVF